MMTIVGRMSRGVREARRVAVLQSTTVSGGATDIAL
jgi:hypothetical protein